MSYIWLVSPSRKEKSNIVESSQRHTPKQHINISEEIEER